MLVTPGVCRYCGCNEQCKCADGGPCCWVDTEMTLCSNCLDKLPLAELFKVVAAELQLVGDNTITIEVSMLDLIGALGYLQIGLRHPDAKHMLGAPRARAVVDKWKAMLTELGLAGLAELARRGDDPKHDLPVPGFEHAYRRN